MGMIVSVYTSKDSDYDCTNNGVTNRFDRLCVINVEGPFEPDENTPAVYLDKGAVDGVVKLVPLETGTRWTMFGGNYATTSDSRFSAAVELLLGQKFYGAVAVHDRME